MEVNPRFLVMQVVDESFHLDGYSVLPIEDIDRYRVAEEQDDMTRYVLINRYGPEYLDSTVIEQMNLEDFSFLKQVHKHYPLISVHRGYISDTKFSVGRIVRVEEDFSLLHEVSTEACWIDGLMKFDYDDVTRIDFGGAYEEALWMYVSRDSEDGEA